MRVFVCAVRVLVCAVSFRLCCESFCMCCESFRLCCEHLACAVGYLILMLGFCYRCNQFVSAVREVSFFTGRGAPENWGDQVLFLRSKGGIKRFFQIKKGGSLILFKDIKYFVKHFRAQMELLLILQKRCSFESVSCWNSSKRGQELQFARGGYPLGNHTYGI